MTYKKKLGGVALWWAWLPLAACRIAGSWCGQFVGDGIYKSFGGGLRLFELGIQFIAESHELIDSGDNAFLLGEGGKGDIQFFEFTLGDMA